MADLEQFLTKNDRVRLDVWLWAGRFFKTRSLCKQAIDGGKVQLDGQRAKASRMIAGGEVVSISRGQEKVEVTVVALAEKRGPASVACQLYEETEASRQEREKQAEIRRINQQAMTPATTRPTKKQRRQIHRFKSSQ